MRKTTVCFLMLLLVLPLAACNASAPGQEEDKALSPEGDFSAEEAYGHIEVLTGEEMEGRRAGTEGNRRAKAYIKEHFSSLGLIPLGDQEDYYQWYNQQDLTFTKEATLNLLDEQGEVHKEFTNRRDYVLLRRAVSGEGSNYFQRDFKDSDFSLESSILLIEEETMGENASLDIDSPIILAESMDQLQLLLREHREEIEGLILLPRDPISNFTGGPLEMYLKPALLNLDRDIMDDDTPDIMYITNSVFDEILSYKDQGYTLEAKGGFTHEEVSVANVIGGYESPEDTADTLLMIAHFDHLGKDSDGSVNPGALDNASGTAVMMEMARVIAEENLEFPFNIEFIAFNGEEDGLLGSFHYADIMEHNPEDLKVINLDMVGSKEMDHLLIDAADQVPEEKLHGIIEDILEERDVEYQLQRNSGASDHIPFSLMGADVVLFLDYSNHIFDNHYHNHYDTLDIIDRDRLGLFGEVLLETLQRIE